LELALGDMEASAAHDEAAEAAQTQTDAPTPPAVGTARRRRGPRRPLPEHLPREIVRHEPPSCCAACGGDRLSVIGEDSREVLEFVPAHFKSLPPRRRG
jgi:transposase